jgi:8-oxo-dGTP pyrophosphatase MutT (NUDIX family)
MEVHARDAEANSKVLFDGELVRLRDYAPVRDETAGTRGLRLDTQVTSYFDFVSSNHSWGNISSQAAQSLRESELVQGISSMRASQLANPLSVIVSLVLQHRGREWLVVQRRNGAKNFHGQAQFVAAAAGMVSATRDLRSGEINVFSTAVNELWEEAGLRVTETDVRFLALLRETSLRDISLVAEVALDRDPDTIVGLRADSFESLGFVACRATPEDLAEFLEENGPYERFSPVSVGAMLFSLLRRFSLDRVERALLSMRR